MKLSTLLVFLGLTIFFQISAFSQTYNTELREIKTRLAKLENKQQETGLDNLTISGQMTLVYQSSDYSPHKNSAGTFSSDIILTRKFSDGVFEFDIQYANGTGVDAKKQGGAMVNNEVMEDTGHHNQPYLAKAFYEQNFHPFSSFDFTVDIGKMGVNDFFDLGLQVSDQTTQFLNQAINNNGAFDFAQDLSGHGYTYGVRMALENDNLGVDIGYFSSDSYLDNIQKKYSLVGAVRWSPEWFKGTRSLYQVYVFENHGEYGEFTDTGAFHTADNTLINTENNADTKDKKGFGVSINQAFPNGIDVFFKYGKQDDDRDVRHYQDMDESYLFGVSVQGHFWKRESDNVGAAIHIGKLTGNHRLAHETGYSSLFDRTGGIGAGQYKDERVVEFYYRYALNENMGLSADYQQISNFNYSKQSEEAKFLGLRFSLRF